MPLAQAQSSWERQATPFQQLTCHPFVLAPECVAKEVVLFFQDRRFRVLKCYGWKQCGELKEIWDKLQLDRVDSGS